MGQFRKYQQKSITEQVDILNRFFPNVGFTADKKIARGKPKNAGRWFVIPRWQTIATTYNGAVKIVLGMVENIIGNREFYNFCKKELGPDRLRQSVRTVKAFRELGKKQKNQNALVVAAQFDDRYFLESVLSIREDFQKNEFGLGVFHVGSMLLTHPERMDPYFRGIDCCGDEYDVPGADMGFGSWYTPPKPPTRFDFALYFKGDEHHIELNRDWIGHMREGSGSATGTL